MLFLDLSECCRLILLEKKKKKSIFTHGCTPSPVRTGHFTLALFCHTCKCSPVANTALYCEHRQLKWCKATHAALRFIHSVIIFKRFYWNQLLYELHHYKTFFPVPWAKGRQKHSDEDMIPADSASNCPFCKQFLHLIFLNQNVNKYRSLHTHTVLTLNIVWLWK